MAACVRISVMLTAALAAMASTAASAWDDGKDSERLVPLAVFAEVGRLSLGEPLAIAVDFDGNAIVADGSPGRLVTFDRAGKQALESEQPPGNPGFYPTDIALYGFFTYAVDEAERALVRFDKDGTFRNVLLNFDQLTGTRRVSPYGIGTDAQGRIAITDIENHQVLLLDSFLRVDILFRQLWILAGSARHSIGCVVHGDRRDRRDRQRQSADPVLHRRRRTAASRPRAAMNRTRCCLPRRAVVAADGTLYVADPEAEGNILVRRREAAFCGVLCPAGWKGFQPTDLEIQRGWKAVRYRCHESVFSTCSR